MNLKKNPPVSVEVSNGILKKRLDLTLNFSTSKLPLGTIPHSAATRNIGNNAIQTKCNFMPKGDLLNVESIDEELVTSITKLGYSLEEVQREVRNKESYIRTIYDKYAKQKRIKQTEPECSKAKTPKGVNIASFLNPASTKANCINHGFTKLTFR